MNVGIILLDFMGFHENFQILHHPRNLENALTIIMIISAQELEKNMWVHSRLDYPKALAKFQFKWSKQEKKKTFSLPYFLMLSFRMMWFRVLQSKMAAKMAMLKFFKNLFFLFYRQLTIWIWLKWGGRAWIWCLK